jgi:hypothetical protein
MKPARQLLAVTLLAVALVVPAAAVPAQGPDFSGTWRLDADGSDIAGEQGLAGLGGAAPEWLHITQARNGALILSSRVNGAQPRFYMIGGENELPAPGGELERMTVATAWEGNRLVSTGRTEFEGASYELREVMSLQADGDVLRLEVVTTHGERTISNDLLYRRQRR